MILASPFGTSRGIVNSAERKPKHGRERKLYRSGRNSGFVKTRLASQRLRCGKRWDLTTSPGLRARTGSTIHMLGKLSASVATIESKVVKTSTSDNIITTKFTKMFVKLVD